MSLWPRFSVVEYWFGSDNKDSEWIVRCKGKCFHIVLYPYYLFDSPALLEQYTRFAEAVDADDESEGLTTDDLQDWALQPFLPLFQAIEPAIKSSELYTLYDYLNPETFHYKLLAINETLIPVPGDQASQRSRPLGANLRDYELSTMCHSFNPRQIQICAANLEDALCEPPTKVLADGKTCHLKPLHPGDEKCAIRELETYRRLENLHTDAELLQVPRLHGVVYDDETSRCLGLLLSWIDCENSTLKCALRRDVPIHTRQKWMDQLTTTLEALHQAGVIWGDVKPANILVESSDDIWIIDFGGGCTRGWVDRDKACTLEGDQQGLLKIMELLAPAN